tara:strand:+ start:327 stop:659 length:333 start_codon:yes stop_codon:yes gene_type:complete
MNGFLSYHSGNVPIAAQNRNSLADQHLRVPATDLIHIEKTVFIDMCHLKSDLVDVTCQHDVRVASWVHSRERVATNIDSHFRCERFGLLTPHPGSPDFESGRPRGIEKAF